MDSHDALLFGLVESIRVEIVTAFVGVLLFLKGMRCLLAYASWRTPVTCQETFIPGEPPAILKWLPEISSAM